MLCCDDDTAEYGPAAYVRHRRAGLRDGGRRCTASSGGWRRLLGYGFRTDAWAWHWFVKVCYKVRCTVCYFVQNFVQQHLLQQHKYVQQGFVLILVQQIPSPEQSTTEMKQNALSRALFNRFFVQQNIEQSILFRNE